jgi:hypothetical protein
VVGDGNGGGGGAGAIWTVACGDGGVAVVSGDGLASAVITAPRVEVRDGGLGENSSSVT